jgi:hypothetical protein
VLQGCYKSVMRLLQACYTRITSQDALAGLVG